MTDNSQDGSLVGENDIEVEGEAGQTETRNQSENALKTGTLLSELIDGSASKDADDNQLIEDIGAEEDIAGQTKEVNTKSRDTNFINSMAEEELPVESDSGDDGLINLKTTQFTDNAADLSENDNNAEDLSSKLMTGFMGNLNHKSGVKNYSFSSAEVSQKSGVDSEISNINLINNSNITYEGGKASEGLLTGNVTRTSGFNELIDKIVYAVKGNSRLGVTIENDKLGRLNVNLSLEKGMVNVHINTSERAVREFVENNIQHIVESLAKNGVSVGGFSVALKDHQDHAESRFIMDGRQEKETIKEPINVRGNNGLVNIFV
jgi:flagellar hook-length control protein FliK